VRVLAATAFGLYVIAYFMRAEFTVDASFVAFMAPQLIDRDGARDDGGQGRLDHEIRRIFRPRRVRSARL
jgi:hypothetical protein